MVKVINYIDVGSDITWDQAKTIAESFGAALYSDDHERREDFDGLEELAGHGAFKETQQWIGVSALPGGGYQYLNGNPVVNFDHFYNGNGGAGDPNADGDPTNDIAHPVLEGKFWQSPTIIQSDPPEPIPLHQLVVEYPDGTNSFTGSQYDDNFFGPLEANQVIRAGYGNDNYYGLGGGTLIMGPGDDTVNIGSYDVPWSEWLHTRAGVPFTVGEFQLPAPTIVEDGDGSDTVFGATLVRAAIDGDNDEYDSVRVSYANDVLGLYRADFNSFITGAGIGTDNINALDNLLELVGGSGDDHLAGVMRLYGGAGNDYLMPSSYEGSTKTDFFADGGDGNDTLVANTIARVELRGGAGDDRLEFFTTATASGGTGTDRFVFQNAVQATLNDWQPGEYIDITALTNRSVSELFSSGYLKVDYKSGYTNVQYDADGGGNGFTPLASLKGSFTQATVAPWILTGYQEPLHPINIVTLDHGISWEQANAAAIAAGGRLFLDKQPVGSDWLANIGDAAGDSRLYENQKWFGITADPSGGYKWVDGTQVATLKFGPAGDPNADGNPNNDILHPTVSGVGWTAPSEPITSYIIEYTNTSSIHGTSGDDVFFGGAAKGETLSAGNGNDKYFGPGGGTISLGNGDDVLALGEGNTPTPWTIAPIQDGTIISDGAGRDNIDAQGGVVKASIDGDNDIFANLTRVSYGDATTSIIASGGLVTGAAGQDTLINVLELSGGKGNDQLADVARLQGGDGNDLLKPGAIIDSNGVGMAYADGGNGNDTLYTSSLARAELRGGAGDDIFMLSNAATVSGGSGNDTFNFNAVAPVTINDLQAGEHINLSSLLPAISIEQAFDDGYLSVSKANGYTTLSIDTDGGGDHFQDLAILKGNYNDVHDHLLTA